MERTDGSTDPTNYYPFFLTEILYSKKPHLMVILMRVWEIGNIPCLDTQEQALEYIQRHQKVAPIKIESPQNQREN